MMKFWKQTGRDYPIFVRVDPCPRFLRWLIGFAIAWAIAEIFSTRLANWLFAHVDTVLAWWDWGKSFFP
jgi:hypothetical protein